jgi:hypothetical protein
MDTHDVAFLIGKNWASGIGWGFNAPVTLTGAANDDRPCGPNAGRMKAPSCSSLSRLGAALSETRRPRKTSAADERQAREADQQHRHRRNFRDQCR